MSAQGGGGGGSGGWGHAGSKRGREELEEAEGGRGGSVAARVEGSGPAGGRGVAGGADVASAGARGVRAASLLGDAHESVLREAAAHLEALFGRHGGSRGVEIEGRVRGVSERAFRGLLASLQAARDWSRVEEARTVDYVFSDRSRVSVPQAALVAGGTGAVPSAALRRERKERMGRPRDVSVPLEALVSSDPRVGALVAEGRGGDVSAALRRLRAEKEKEEHFGELRFACAREEELPMFGGLVAGSGVPLPGTTDLQQRAPDGSAALSFVRFKHRLSFHYRDEFIFDLTVVREGDRFDVAEAARPAYEVELEWCGQHKRPQPPPAATAQRFVHKLFGLFQEICCVLLRDTKGGE
jgi:hypothetical protein